MRGRREAGGVLEGGRRWPIDRPYKEKKEEGCVKMCKTCVRFKGITVT